MPDLNNGKTGVFLRFCKEIEPGAMIVLGLFVVGLGIALNLSVRCLELSQALMQRDISSINLRMSSPEYTPTGSVPIEVHREQIEMLHMRIRELSEEDERIWIRINTLVDR